ncbi:MAG: hypothetical protein H0V82_04200 [Candidatus Protochlamydia sp.]|nr:hypothetical protein [Candidatus Protochlamydia sp.]
MQISLKSTLNLALNTGVGALCLYKTPSPYHWLGAFVVGLFSGLVISGRELNKANSFYFPGNSTGETEETARQKRIKGVRYFG